MKRIFTTLLVSGLLVMSAAAQEEDMQAMQEAWMKAATPGEHHKLLNPLVGNWTVTARFRMEPEGEWMSETSDASSKWIMDDRFVMHEYSGSSMGMSDRPFEGLAIMGYDNAAEEYVSFWIDNHSTTAYIGRGVADESGRVITINGTYTDPMTGDEKAHRWVYRIADDGGYVMEMYENAPSGEEFMSGEITYKPRSS